MRDYQHSMIEHYHGTKGFDDWNTVLANEFSMQHSGQPTGLLCQQWAAAFAKASALVLAGFRAYAAGLATAATAQYAKCGGGHR